MSPRPRTDPDRWAPRPAPRVWDGDWKHEWAKHRRARRRRRHGPRGLRRRLTLRFVVVALAAVSITTWAAIGAVASLGEDLTDPASPAYLGRAWDDVEEGAEVLGRAATGRVARTALVAGALSFLVASFAAAALTRRLTRPLVELTDGARRFADGERGIRVRPPSADDEVRSLALSFNALAEGLERQEAWRRTLVADVAHDLRTPLAVLRSEIEAMQDGVRPRDDASLARAHAQVLMLAGLVSDLRTLSLAEGGGIDATIEPLSGPELLTSLAETFAAGARDGGSEIVVETPPGWTVLADRTLLTRILGNLIDNALRYAPGRIVLEGGPTSDGQASLAVRDHGDGLSAEARERVFERFYREDAARARDDEGSRASGLGLAIARALTERMGGRIEATAAHPGARFVVTLPSDRAS